MIFPLFSCYEIYYSGCNGRRKLWDVILFDFFGFLWIIFQVFSSQMLISIRGLERWNFLKLIQPDSNFFSYIQVFPVKHLEQTWQNPDSGLSSPDVQLVWLQSISEISFLEHAEVPFAHPHPCFRLRKHEKCGRDFPEAVRALKQRWLSG